ncbi:MAG: N-acetyl-gamma-glutamyl-phosphate reductase [Bryobacterales bacterium]|nr:N-acetyl-gamma-glutamyl-phosphate reductase [Bryobacterales bacterium]
MATKTRVGIVGFTGYSGAELLRILKTHPCAEPVLLEHRAVADSELPFGEDTQRIPFRSQSLRDEGIQVVFLATSLEVSMETAPMVLEAGARCIDLSAAFRLRTTANYDRWYKVKHTCPELLADAAYGLPEFFRQVVKISTLVANPGCYPTAVSLAVRPLIVEAILDRSAGVICDAKSGASGAGRKPALKTHFCEVTENLSAYGVLFHRHVPEILHTTDVDEHELSFTAQLLPVHRGILETIYVRTEDSIQWSDLLAVYQKYYRDEPFVRLYPEGRLPDLRGVCGTNFCDIGFHVDPPSRRVVIVAAIDNLVKGAAGQAVQNMNLLLECPETAGLLDGEAFA